MRELQNQMGVGEGERVKERQGMSAVRCEGCVRVGMEGMGWKGGEGDR